MLSAFRIMCILYVLIIAFNIVKLFGSSKKSLLGNYKRCFPMSLFFSFTILLFYPSSVILSNSNDFLVSYGKIYAITFCGMLVAIIGILGISGLIKNRLFNDIYLSIIWGVCFASYIQSNFLNPRLPELNGKTVDWTNYSERFWIEGLVWALVILVPSITIIIKEKIVYGIEKWSAYLLCSMQLVSLIVLLLTSSENLSNVAVTKEGEFTVGENENVIVFVLDSLSPTQFKNAINDNPDLLWGGSDFTLYTNSVAGGSYTLVGMPTLLTGMEYDPEYMSYTDYLNEAWTDTTLYDDMNTQGYDVRIFTDGRYLTAVTDEDIANITSSGEGYYISEVKGFTRQLYKLVGYYAFPTFLKKYCWMYTDDITNYIVTDYENVKMEDLAKNNDGSQFYQFDDDLFHRELDENRLNITTDKAYRLYHIMGPHAPFVLDRNGYVAEGETTEVDQTVGSLRIVEKYIGILKEMKLYDSSTIIITADHGRGFVEDGIQHNECFAIKEKDSSHGFVTCDSPIHARNVYATIAKASLQDAIMYGPSVYDISEQSDVQRLHTAARASCEGLFPELSEGVDYYRFEIPTDVSDLEQIKQYHPEDTNFISYQMGDEIIFDKYSTYCDELNYRLYYENGHAYASNELPIIVDLDNYDGGELSLNFILDDIMNVEQNIKIYANGYRIANMTCSQYEVSDIISVMVPEKCIEDKKLSLRFVFKNAVSPRMIEGVDDDRILSVAFYKMWINKMEE